MAWPQRRLGGSNSRWRQHASTSKAAALRGGMSWEGHSHAAEVPEEPRVGCQLCFSEDNLLVRSSGHLGYSVQSLDKRGNACPQSKSRIRTEAHYLLSSRPSLFHQCDLQPPVLVLGFSRSSRTTFTLFFLPPPS